MGSKTVVLVLDREYGEKLRQLTQQMSVWIIDSPENSASAREYWQSNPEPEHMLTTFRDPGTFGEANFEYWMDQIELHHGHYSQMPPFQELEVIRLEPTTFVEQVLAAYDFRITNRTATGFRAIRKHGCAGMEANDRRPTTDD